MATMGSVMSGSAAADVIDDLSVIEKHRGVGMLAWSSWMR
jgi:hypothetical protein